MSAARKIVDALIEAGESPKEFLSRHEVGAPKAYRFCVGSDQAVSFYFIVVAASKALAVREAQDILFRLQSESMEVTGATGDAGRIVGPVVHFGEALTVDDSNIVSVASLG